ncbi:MAG: P-loop NTPase [Kofleriaceae bacterium]|nr:P-loop NTPase [Kofleriaceae bacterium]MBP9166742.1 P-loop NTPase [Kofleriaceae bacterium]MBP9857154.1 P-loop NTPase [Kofleriaceae bacterium]
MVSPPPRAGRVVAVAGGKGGVGKSLVALNLAVTLGRQGYRTTLIDADLGAPNLHTMLGITRPGPGLGGFIDHEASSLDEIALEVEAAPNLWLVPGSARVGAANINAGQKLRLLRAIARRASDVVIVDVGAGMAWNTVDLVIAADFKLIVMTPQLTSIQNAYAFLKTCVQRVIRRLPEEAAVRRELDERFAGDGGARPIRKVLAELATTDALLAERATDVLSRFGALLFGNMLAQPADDQVLTRMAAMIDDYLMIRAPVLGGLPLADPIRRSIDLRQPFALGRGPADAQAALRRLARGILDADVAALRTAARSGVPARTLPIWIDGDVRAM